MWVHNINPVLLDLGVLQIRWYGLMYVLGFLFVWWYVRRQIRTGTVRLSEQELDSWLSWAVVGMIIGARLGAVLIYNFSYYFANPWKIIAIWEGGLSYHGAFVGIVIAIVWWCKKYKKNFLEIADIFVVPISLANSFGRIGNFINGELPGRLTSVPWAVKFPFVEGWRHPSQLYEALYNVIIFSILRHKKSKQHKPGTILAGYLVLYAIFRSITEFFREPEILVGPLTMGQFLNAIMFVVGLGLWWYVNRVRSK
ncbi:MAG: prolipoprotein diacylglyceryl transferase [Candidatus Woesearchaeota archaeon]|nr:prolipoprotein diacylglyceryl transferase [Candidatus Woesearchaeota archaeon]